MWLVLLYSHVICSNHIVSELIYLSCFDLLWFSFVWKLVLYHPVQFTNSWFLIWPPEIVSIVMLLMVSIPGIYYTFCLLRDLSQVFVFSLCLHLIHWILLGRKNMYLYLHFLLFQERSTVNLCYHCFFVYLKCPCCLVISYFVTVVLNIFYLSHNGVSLCK